MKRRLAVGAAIVVFVLGVGAAGGFGFRVGRRFERNQACCDLPRRHNLAVSIREALRLLWFPSQIGQDRWVAEKVFPGVTDGYFVDVGSADGYFGSNTWALEQRGWRGICIDPFPRNMKERTCQVFENPVDSVGGRSVVFKPAGELGGISDYLPSWNTDARNAEGVRLTTATLGEILGRANAPRAIQYMSLDIEGAELQALRGFPFDRYTLGALTVEHNYEEPKRTEVIRLLRDNGYDLVRRWMQDDYFVQRQSPAGK